MIPPNLNKSGLLSEIIHPDWLHPLASSYGKLLLRVGVGMMFVLYGLEKFSAISNTISFFTTLFGAFGPVFAYLVAACELFFGLLLIAGVFTRLCGLILGFILTVAIFTTLIRELLTFSTAGPAFQVVALCFTCFALFFFGGGKLSVDSLLRPQ